MPWVPGRWGRQCRRGVAAPEAGQRCFGRSCSTRSSAPGQRAATGEIGLSCGRACAGRFRKLGRRPRCGIAGGAAASALAARRGSRAAAVRGGCGRGVLFLTHCTAHSVLAGPTRRIGRTAAPVAAGYYPTSCHTPIQMVLCDVLDHPVGDEVPDRGSPATRARQSVDEIARAGTSSRLTSWSGNPVPGHGPGRVTPTKCARDHSSSTSFQDRIWVRASAPVMKNSSASGPHGVQVPERVDGVGRPGPVDVDPADGEPRVRGGGDDGHQVAVLGLADLLAHLLPRAARWARRPLRPGRTRPRPRWPRRGARGGSGRTCRPSHRDAGGAGRRAASRWRKY